jgi:branched-chain amino acid transport system permease protein
MTNKGKFSIGVIVGVILVLLPLAIASDYIINFLLLVFIYVGITQSWNILGGYTGQINIGQSAFFGVGVLTTRILWVAGTPIYLAFLAGGVAAILLAAIIGLPTLRLRGIYFAIGTLGIAVILRITIGNIFPGVSFLPGKYLATYSLIPRYYLALISMVMILGAIHKIVNSTLGLALLAIREDEEAAKAAGVNTFKYKVLALAISTFFAGLTGGVYAFYSASYYYHVPFELIWSFEPLLIAFIGGTGTIIGPTIGAAAYVALKELFAITLPEISVIVFGILFILVVLFLPGGLVEVAGKVSKLLAFHNRSQ